MPQEQQEEEPRRQKEDRRAELAVSDHAKRSRPSVPVVDVMKAGLHIANGITDVVEIIIHSLL